MHNTKLDRELVKQMESNPTAVHLSTIREKVKNYHIRMNGLALQSPGSALARNLDQDYLQFYIDKPALKRLVEMSELKDCKAIAVFFGIEAKEGTEKLTACFLGVDEKGLILQAHKDGIALCEENWPPPPFGFDAVSVDQGNCFTLASNVNNVYKFFL